MIQFFNFLHFHNTLHTHTFFNYCYLDHYYTNRTLYVIIFIAPSICYTIFRNSVVSAVVWFACSQSISIWLIQYVWCVHIHTRRHTHTILLLLLSSWVFHISNLSVHNFCCKKQSGIWFVFSQTIGPIKCFWCDHWYTTSCPQNILFKIFIHLDFICCPFWSYSLH